MRPDDEVCLCKHVSQRKLVNFLLREKPPCASGLAECLGAGTGCGWCVPFLKQLHEQWRNGEVPAVSATPDNYGANRGLYREHRRAEKAAHAAAETGSQ